LHSALIGLMHDFATPLIRCRAPLADVFDMAETAGANSLLIQPTDTDTG